jgi:hypothetical protein
MFTIILRQGYLSLNLRPAVREIDLYLRKPFFLIAANNVLKDYLLFKIAEFSASRLMFL